MNLENLEPGTLEAAKVVAAELFPWEREHQLALPASLAPDAYRGFYEARGLESVRCWLPVKEKTVGGLATVYAYRNRPEELWLAWFGLRPMLRGAGAGARALEWIARQAMDEGRRMLRLWTTDEAEYAAAVKLYRRHGFVEEVVPALPGESWRTLVFTRMLDGRRSESFAQSAPAFSLCGRESPSGLALAA